MQWHHHNLCRLHDLLCPVICLLTNTVTSSWFVLISCFLTNTRALSKESLDFMNCIASLVSFSYKKVHLIMPSGKWWPICPHLNVLSSKISVGTVVTKIESIKCNWKCCSQNVGQFCSTYLVHFLWNCCGIDPNNLKSTLVQLWVIVDQYLCHHMASLESNELTQLSG